VDPTSTADPDVRGGTPGKAGVKTVTRQAPRVHVHLLMRLHMNGVMIRDS